MILRNDVMPLLVSAAPSLGALWAEIEHDPIHVDDESGGRLHYLDAGEVARQLVELQRQGNRTEIARAFEVIEQLHTDGDDYVRELVTIGYLEGVQFATSHVEDVSDDDFEPYLGTESRRWWLGLNAFWSGKAGGVEALDADI